MDEAKWEYESQVSKLSEFENLALVEQSKRSKSRAGSDGDRERVQDEEGPERGVWAEYGSAVDEGPEVVAKETWEGACAELLGWLDQEAKGLFQFFGRWWVWVNRYWGAWGPAHRHGVCWEQRGGVGDYQCGWWRRVGKDWVWGVFGNYQEFWFKWEDIKNLWVFHQYDKR